MSWQYTPFMLPVIAAALVSGLVAALIAFRRLSRESLPLMILLVAVTLWNAAYALRMGYADLPSKIFWARVRYLGIVATPAAWFAFVTQYTGYGHRFSSRRLAWLAVEPVCVTLLVWTNGVFHSLIWRDIHLELVGTFMGWDAVHGIGYWGHTAYSYMLLFISIVLLLRALNQSQSLYHGQILSLLFGAFVALFLNALSVFKLTRWVYLDLTSIGFALASLIFAWGLFQFRLMDIVPVAYDVILEGIEDAILVTDTRYRVVNVNPVACRIFQRSSAEMIGMSVADLSAALPDVVDASGTLREMRTDVTLGEAPARRYYEAQVSALRRHEQDILGWCLALHDITERRSAEQAQRVQKQLYESLVTVSRVTTEKLDLETTLQNTLRVAAAISDAEKGSLFIIDDSFRITHSIFSYGASHPGVEESMLHRVMESGLSGWVVRNRKSALLTDVLLDDRWVSVATQKNTRSALCVPILGREGSVLGVLTLTHTAVGHFTEAHLKLMDAASEQMALAWYNAQVYEDQLRLARRSAILYEVLRTVGGELNPKSVPQMAVDIIARLTGWPSVAILMPDDSGESLMVQAASSLLAVAQGWRVPLHGGTPGRVFSSGKLLYIADTSTYLDYDPATSLRSRLLIPMHRGEHVLGVLDIASDIVAAFGDVETQMLGELLAESVALALDVAQSHAQIGGYVADLSALFAVSGVIGRSLVLEDLLSQILSATLNAVEFDAGVVALLDEWSGALSIAAETLRRPTDLESRDFSELMRHLCEYTYRHAGPVVVEDIQYDFVIPHDLLTAIPDLPEHFREMRGRAYIGVPLLYQDRPVGVLGLFSEPPKPSLRHEMTLFMAIGRQIAMGVVNAQLFRAVEDERGRLYALIESTGEGILFVDTDINVALVNVRLLDFLEITDSPAYWRGRPASELESRLDSGAAEVLRGVLATMQQPREGKSLLGEDEFDLSSRVFRWLHTPVLAGDMPLGWLLMLRDVTEERLIERMQNDMTHTMVHDLRNPLTGISGSIKLLRRTLDTASLTDGQQQVLDILENSGKRMVTLVNSILDIGRLESGQMPLDLGIIHLDALVTEVLDLQLPLAIEKGVHLEKVITSGALDAWGDADLIERALHNLVGNAIKFTRSGGAVTVAVEHGSAGAFLISVKDTGTGVPLDVQGRLFQKFVTGEQVERGSGLGLAFCKMVLEAHGERIWLAETSDAGAVFTFSLSPPPVP